MHLVLRSNDSLGYFLLSTTWTCALLLGAGYGLVRLVVDVVRFFWRAGGRVDGALSRERRPRARPVGPTPASAAPMPRFAPVDAHGQRTGPRPPQPRTPR